MMNMGFNVLIVPPTARAMMNIAEILGVQESPEILQ